MSAGGAPWGARVDSVRGALLREFRTVEGRGHSMTWISPVLSGLADWGHEGYTWARVCSGRRSDIWDSRGYTGDGWYARDSWGTRNDCAGEELGTRWRKGRLPWTKLCLGPALNLIGGSWDLVTCGRVTNCTGLPQGGGKCMATVYGRSYATVGGVSSDWLGISSDVGVRNKRGAVRGRCCNDGGAVERRPREPRLANVNRRDWARDRPHCTDTGGDAGSNRGGSGDWDVNRECGDTNRDTHRVRNSCVGKLGAWGHRNLGNTH